MSEQPTSGVPEWDLADRLRKALRHADVGVQDMADWLEVSRHTIGNWINGHTRPRPSDLKQWALRTGVDYQWLSSGHAKNPRPEQAGDTDSNLSGYECEIQPTVRQDITQNFRKLLPARVHSSADLAIAR